jgi:ATP-dependent Lon protease
MNELSSINHPVLPLRDIVVFPHMIVRLFVGREKSVRALEEVMKDDKQILLASQMDAGEDDPSPDTIFKTGVLANVLQILKLPDGAVKILVEGMQRVEIKEFLDNKDFFQAKAVIIEETVIKTDEVEALRRSVVDDFERYGKLNKNVPEEAFASILDTEEPGKLADTVSGHLGISVEKKQQLLECFDVGDRLEKIYALMQGEMSVLKVEKKIKSRVKTQMEKNPTGILSKRTDEGDPKRAG